MKAVIFAIALQFAVSISASAGVIDAESDQLTAIDDSQQLATVRRPYLSAAEAAALQYREVAESEAIGMPGAVCQPPERGTAQERC